MAFESQRKQVTVLYSVRLPSHQSAFSWGWLRKLDPHSASQAFLLCTELDDDGGRQRARDRLQPSSTVLARSQVGGDRASVPPLATDIKAHDSERLIFALFGLFRYQTTVAKVGSIKFSSDRRTAARLSPREALSMTHLVGECRKKINLNTGTILHDPSKTYARR